MLNQTGLALVSACLVTAAAAFAADTPTTAPATPTAAIAATDTPTTAPAITDAELKQQLRAGVSQIHTIIKDPRQLLDPVARVKLAPDLTPALHHVQALLEQVDQLHPDSAASTREMRYQMLTFLAVLGDSGAIKTLDAAGANKNIDESLAAKSSQQLVAWLLANKDADAQKKVLDNLDALSKANPKDDSLPATLWVMSKFGPASPENSARALDIITADLKGEVAQQIQLGIAQQKEMDAASAGMKAMENKPLVISGPLVGGKVFTTADWKGKVILVDFWASWCGPCKAELPRVKKVYEDYHAKGLEVLGVSNDQSAEDMNSYIKDDGGMPWPQLFDAGAAGKGDWNPITMHFGINGIPVMFLIDKNGVLRSTGAREDFEAQIPKLLAETGEAPATQPTPAPAPQK